MLLDGALVSTAKAHVHVELLVLGRAGVDAIVDGFGGLAHTVEFYSDVAAIKLALRRPHAAESALRIVIMRQFPMSPSTKGQAVSLRALAANAIVAQATAIADALDAINGLRGACSDGLFFTLAYQAHKYRSGKWEVSHNTIALLPKGKLSVKSPMNVHILPTMILQLLGIDTSREMLHDSVSLTVDSSKDLWTCTCRLLHEAEHHEIVRYFPAFSLDSLPSYFLRMDDPADWRVRDSAGLSDNLAEDEAWFSGSVPSALLKRCLPAVRDMTRRRCVANDFLSMAEHVAMERLPVPSPDDVVTVPSEPAVGPAWEAAAGPASEPAWEAAAGPASEPAWEAAVGSASGPAGPAAAEADVAVVDASMPASAASTRPWKEMLHQMVTTSYGEECAFAVENAVHQLKESPYTLIVDPSSNAIIALHGAHPPSVLQHLSRTRTITTLPTTTNDYIRIHLDDHQNIRVGQLKLDIDSFIHCERIALYRSRTRRADAVSRKQYFDKGNRGSIKGFAAKIELARQRMRR